MIIKSAFSYFQDTGAQDWVQVSRWMRQDPVGQTSTPRLSASLIDARTGAIGRIIPLEISSGEAGALVLCVVDFYGF